ncbi:hypothetical protein F183_A10550 [Bryobacterales bacterium F-183]|nr:hypothetical protein F183_A10550 [Bryobacterales bacterium F-183]
MIKLEGLDTSLYITDIAVARRLGLSIATIRRWRLTNDGPPFVKFGSCVRYRLPDVDSWAAAREVSR